MGKSFVLKGLSGRPGGYVMQAPGALRIRVQGFEGKKARLIVIYADGKERSFCVDCADGEMEKPDAGGTLSAAYVTVEGALVLHTGDAAQKAFENSRVQAQMRHDLNEEKAVRAAVSISISHTDQQPRQREKEETEVANRKGKASRTQEGEQDQCTQSENKVATQANTASTPSCGEAVSDEDSRDMGGPVTLGDTHMECAMPERRWPPPPCMPRARYVSGCWEEG